MFQDILTDFSVEPEKIPLDDGDPTWFGHKVCTLECSILSDVNNVLSFVNLYAILSSFFQGMIRAALYLKKKLETGYLAQAFHSDPVCSFS